MNGPKVTQSDIRDAVDAISAARGLVSALAAKDDTLSAGVVGHLGAAADLLGRHLANPPVEEKELTDMGYEIRDCAACGERGPTKLLGDRWHCSDGAACADRRLRAAQTELTRIRGY